MIVSKWNISFIYISRNLNNMFLNLKSHIFFRKENFNIASIFMNLFGEKNIKIFFHFQQKSILL